MEYGVHASVLRSTGVRSTEYMHVHVHVIMYMSRRIHDMYNTTDHLLLSGGALRVKLCIYVQHVGATFSGGGKDQHCCQQLVGFWPQMQHHDPDR